MRNLCLVFACTLNLALAATPAPGKGSAKTVPDSAKTAAPVKAPVAPPPAAAPADPTEKNPAPVIQVTVPLSAPAKDSSQAAVPPPAADSASATVVPESVDTAAVPALAEPAPAAAPMPLALAAPDKTSRALVNDWGLAGRQYLFGVAGQAVAGALGFFIGSAIETAIAGEEDAHKGTLSFTEIRYDNGFGAFYGGAIGGLLGSSLTTYFVGQSDEEDGSFFWTMVGTGLAGAGAMYVASAMGVNDEADWKPFLPLLAIPTAGGVLGFNASRWFSDRKRERIMGPDAGLRIHAPRLAWLPTPDGQVFRLQALNLSF